MPNDTTVGLWIQHVLYVPVVRKWLYSLISTGQHNCKSETTMEGTTVPQNGTPFIIGKLSLNKLHHFNPAPTKNQSEVPWETIATLTD